MLLEEHSGFFCVLRCVSLVFIHLVLCTSLKLIVMHCYHMPVILFFIIIHLICRCEKITFRTGIC